MGGSEWEKGLGIALQGPRYTDRVTGRDRCPVVRGKESEMRPATAAGGAAVVMALRLLARALPKYALRGLVRRSAVLFPERSAAANARI